MTACPNAPRCAVLCHITDQTDMLHTKGPKTSAIQAMRPKSLARECILAPMKINEKHMRSCALSIPRVYTFPRSETLFHQKRLFDLEF